jgi:threonylcarbamoyladenosine tRNA methylthiotransferase MtaB
MIQDGCDSFCSYCIIPRIRGGPRSRPLAEILKEAESQIEAGCPEIVLTGIHTGSWGRDLKKGLNLADVIKALLRLDGIPRIRLSSIEVREVTPALLETAASDTRVCPHFPVPLQSGSDRILSLMNRTYTAEEYLAAVRRIREVLPEAALTTDVICGFPGETEDDFADTLSLCREAGFSRIHAFPYSRREGTPAAGMKEQLPKTVKQERVEALSRLGEELAQEFALGCIGENLEVIPESVQDDTGMLYGYSKQYLPVTFPGTPALKGTLCTVTAVKAEDGTVIAKRVV